jgi:outer membrane biosynthesis protein TonB
MPKPEPPAEKKAPAKRPKPEPPAEKKAPAKEAPAEKPKPEAPAEKKAAPAPTPEKKPAAPKPKAAPAPEKKPAAPAPEKKPAAPAPKEGASADLLRTWTDDTGRHHEAAEFVALLESGTVRLVRADGRYVRVAFHRLSEADREYVRRQTLRVALNR